MLYSAFRGPLFWSFTYINLFSPLLHYLVCAVNIPFYSWGPWDLCSHPHGQR